MFDRGVYLDEHTDQTASVEFDRYKQADYGCSSL